MSQGKLSGFAWHSENYKGYNDTYRKCFNCYYFDDNSCNKKMEKISYNHATKCADYKNKIIEEYSIKKKRYIYDSIEEKRELEEYIRKINRGTPVRTVTTDSPKNDTQNIEKQKIIKAYKEELSYLYNLKLFNEKYGKENNKINAEFEKIKNEYMKNFPKSYDKYLKKITDEVSKYKIKKVKKTNPQDIEKMIKNCKNSLMKVNKKLNTIHFKETDKSYQELLKRKEEYLQKLNNLEQQLKK